MAVRALDRLTAALFRRRPTGRGHVLIAGTGRAGTTLLVRICTRLDLDTGFSARDVAKTERNVGRAGLEQPISRETAAKLPEIIKSPHVVDVLTTGMSEGWLPVDCAIIPVRDLHAAAQSRRATRDRAMAQGMDPKKAPGGLWKTDDPAAQEQVLALQFYTVVEALVAQAVPLLFLSFPRFATDADYFVSVAGPLFAERFGVDAERLRAAHVAEAKADFISEFGA